MNYTFNMNIFNALKQGKTVWVKNKYNNWYTITEHQHIECDLTMLYEYEWALEKPKIMIKKRIEPWFNVNKYGDIEYHRTLEDACKGVEIHGAQHYKAVAVPFVLEWEEEE